MNWLFGKKKEASPATIASNNNHDTKIQRTIDKNLATIENLEKRQEVLQKRIDNETERAKQFLQNNNRTAAKQCLVNKKQHQTQYDLLSGQISNLMATNASLENAVLNVDVIKATKATTDVMNDMFKQTGGLDKVEDIMDDSRETLIMADDLGRALAQPIGDALDDDELENEYSALEEAMLDEQLNSMRVGSTKLPTATATAASATTVTTKTSSAKIQKDDLDDLEAELSALV